MKIQQIYENENIALKSIEYVGPKMELLVKNPVFAQQLIFEVANKF